MIIYIVLCYAERCVYAPLPVRIADYEDAPMTTITQREGEPIGVSTGEPSVTLKLDRDRILAVIRSGLGWTQSSTESRMDFG